MKLKQKMICCSSDGQANLEGLEASEETKFTFSQPCTVKHIE